MKSSRKLLLTSICGLAAIGFYACGSTGQQGEPGAAGAKGDSCTVVTNADGTATIKCTDGSSFNIVNGKDGNPGDAGSDGKDGQDGKSCYLTENSDGSAAVVCPYDGSSYIVRGNTDNYANYCKKGFWGKNCENECNCQNEGICNDGVTGDGSCSCKDGWSDEDCSVCPAGFYDGVTKCVDCTKGVANSAFDTDKCTFTDIRTNSTITDKNTYKVVTINGQFWMAENLKAQLDVNGNAVDCHANTDEDTDFIKNYGCLYTWNELATVDNVTNSQNVNRICPDGWHISTKEDFDNLLDYAYSISVRSNFLALIANSEKWTEKQCRNQGGDNFGFGGLPAGSYACGNYDDLGTRGLWWTSTEKETDPNSAFFFNLSYDVAAVYDDLKEYGLSVRCVRN